MVKIFVCDEAQRLQPPGPIEPFSCKAYRCRIELLYSSLARPDSDEPVMCIRDFADEGCRFPHNLADVDHQCSIVEVRSHAITDKPKLSTAYFEWRERQQFSD